MVVRPLSGRDRDRQGLPGLAEQAGRAWRPGGGNRNLEPCTRSVRENRKLAAGCGRLPVEGPRRNKSGRGRPGESSAVTLSDVRSPPGVAPVSRTRTSIAVASTGFDRTTSVRKPRWPGTSVTVVVSDVPGVLTSTSAVVYQWRTRR